MKKIICILLCLCTILTAFGLSSCTKNDNNTEVTAKRTGITTLEAVKNVVMQGKIDGAEFALGTNPDTIKQKYSTTAATNATGEVQGDGTVFDVTDKGDYTRIILGTAQYFYLNKGNDHNISVVACLADAFGFKVGNCYSDTVIDSLGEPDSKDVPAAKDLIYTFGVPNNATRMTYMIDKYRLDFVFTDDNLLATVLTDTSVYKDMGNSATTAAPTTTAAETTAKK